MILYFQIMVEEPSEKFFQFHFQLRGRNLVNAPLDLHHSSQQIKRKIDLVIHS